MKQRIKLKIARFEKAIAIQIEEMDEAFRCEEKIIHYEYNGFTIKSNMGPYLYKNHISLRGYSKSGDYYVPSLHFTSNQEREEYIKKLTESLKHWSENYPWPDQEPKESSEDVIIVEF